MHYVYKYCFIICCPLSLNHSINYFLFYCSVFKLKYIRFTYILLRARTYIYERLSPNYSHLTFERLERESATDILSGCPTLDDLNVKLSKLEDHINHIVFLYRRQHFYWDALGEFPEPPPPPIQFQ